MNDSPELIWDLVRTFFEASSIFAEIYENYETRVLQYAADRGVPREHLRLEAEEVSGLLNFKALETLRTHHLNRLIDISHRTFRTESATDPLDLYVSELYHEVSILTEDHYQVKTFAPQYHDKGEKEAYNRIVAEVHDAFPRKVHNIHDTFEKAQNRLEALLPRWGQDKILLRSLYLKGNELLESHYPGRLEQFYTILYPEGGCAEGYLTVGRSFLDAGFVEEAREAVQKATREPDPLLVEEAPQAGRFRMEASAFLDKIEHTHGRKEEAEDDETT